MESPRIVSSFDPAIAYKDLPPLPPRADLETKAVLKACIGARAAVAELRQAGMMLPNQGVLINTIPLLEAQASSEIENIVTTTDRLFRFAEAGEDAQADPATKEALRHRSALRRAVLSIGARPLSTATAVEICQTLLGVQLDVRRVPGTALVNQSTGETVYTPPEREALLRDLLSNWEMYLHEERDVDPLIRMAVGHYQFEAIHQLMHATREYLQANAPAAYSQELVDLIFVQPYCRIRNVVDAGIAQRQTAAVYLKRLCDVGVLEEAKVGREKLFINPRLMRLLTADDPGDLWADSHGASSPSVV